jgi:hypothetical protein
LVVTIVMFVLLANVPEVPLAGAVKTTEVPEVSTGLPFASSTVALSGVAKAVPTVAFWPLPAVTTTLVAVPAVLVSVKLAEVRLPEVAVNA